MLKSDEPVARKDARKLGIFEDNEQRANHYAAVCLLIAAGVTALMWLLNVLGFFIVDQMLMNFTMPVGIVFLVLPYLILHIGKYNERPLKYIIIGCLLVGVGVMSAALTLQMVLGWACPLILSCHYYSPKVNRFTLVGTLLCMLASFYVGMYFGVWDANLMRSSDVLGTLAERTQHIAMAAQSGDNQLLRGFNFYYLPRAVIIFVVYLVCVMLSKRTQGLLKRQQEITAEKESISTELSIATHIQTSMLPCIFPAFPEREEFDIFATMSPAKEVGGDFYDFFMVDERHLALVMADVSGKGVPAALFMVIGKTLIKDHTQPGRELSDVFGEVNDILCASNSEGLFITAFEGVLDLVTGELRYVNAGHEPPYIAQNGEPFALCEVPAGFVLAGMEGMRYRAGSMTLAPGDMLFQYTDGVTEATDASHQMYGTERLTAVLAANSGRSPTQILPAVKADIDAFVGDAPQFDDITMLCLEYRRKMEESEAAQ